MRAQHEAIVLFIASITAVSFVAASFGETSTTQPSTPIMGAYVHVPNVLADAKDAAARHEAISKSLDRFKASGLRGSLLRSLEDWETQTASQAGQDSPILDRLDQLNRLGFAILTRAAREIRPPRDT